MNLPSGTVTFLLTDIEASTRHWDTTPDAMRRALERHDALAMAVISQHDGVLLKSRGEGDSLFTVFANASRALEAAVTLQLAYVAESWGTETPLSVRMALHTGEAQLREGDYFGPTVNRCARLRSIARGGQILVSDALRQLVGQSLPADIQFRDQGWHQLKGFKNPERIFEVVHPKLKTYPPTGNALDAFPNNLPHQLTSFIGREREIAEVRRLLSTTCLLTLTGAGGCGKTRLALQVAEQVLEHFPDGIWLMELASLSDPALVPQAVAFELKVREEAGSSLTQILTDHLRHKTILLILDNCEHLLASCARLTEDLLRACPNLRILATSRESLNIQGETTFYVPSLSLPDSKQLPPVDKLSEYEAIRLFIDRAITAAPTFAMTDQNAAAICSLCRRLDGIPLAIELAAVRVKSLPVEQIAERLTDRFRLLTGGSRTALPRQQTLRALIDWSYDLLIDRERELFHRISVFVGGFTLEAAETICDFDLSSDATSIKHARSIIQNADVLDLLTALVDKSLLTAEDHSGRVRYRMLETLRQYAREKLAASGMEETLQRRHLAYFVEMAEEAERKLRGSEQAWWLEQLDTEHDNLRAALSWSPEIAEDAEAGLRLAAALWWFWHIRGYFAEGREWLGAKLAAVSKRTADRAKALNGAAVLARNQGDYAAARALSIESLEIKRELGDRQGIASSLNNLAVLALSQGDYAAAQPFYEESLAIERRLGNRQGMTASLIGLGNVALEQGDYDAAYSLYRESLDIKRELGDKRGIATSLFGLGSVALYRGDYAEARDPHEESLAIRRHLGDRRGVAKSLQYLAILNMAIGDNEAAIPMFAESLTIRRELGDKLGIADTVHGQAILAAKAGESALAEALLQECFSIFRELDNRRGMASSLNIYAYLAIIGGYAERAARLLGAADAIRKAIGCPLHAYERSDYNACVTVAQSALGEEEFVAARAAGRSMALDQAVGYALTT